MPKATRNSKFSRVARRIAVADPLPFKAEQFDARAQQQPEPPAENLSRGQKKRLAKREQWKKRERMILASLKLKSMDEKKGIDGLDSIRDALIWSAKDTSAKRPNETQRQLSNKGKRELTAAEVHHMGLVLQHPSFKANPFETMQEHLRNTLAQQKVELESMAKERSDREKVERESKIQQKKKRLQGVKKSKKKFNATRSKY